MEVDDLLEERDHRLTKEGTLELELEGYGYRWLRVRRGDERALS